MAKDIDVELRFHLDMKTAALVAAGLRPDAAAEEALRQFGDLPGARRELAAIDHQHTTRRLRADWIEETWSDLRFAARSLMRTPAFTAVVVLTLALGLGATAAMFGVLDRLLLRAPIGVGDPGQVVRLYAKEGVPNSKGQRLRSQFLFQELDFFDQARSAAVAFGFRRARPVTLADKAGALDARATLVSGTYFQVLGVRPALGRLLLAADDSSGSAPAAVVSFALWKGRYGGLPSIVGRVIHVKDRAYTVVGVAPPGFSGLSPQAADLWLPAGVAAEDVFGPNLHNPHVRMYAFEAVARVRPGFSRERVAGELTLSLRRHETLLPTGFPPPDPGATVVLGSVIPGRSQVELGRDDGSLSLSLLVAAVALVACLIAMANVANLLLLRALGRRRETGIRIALGVSRWRLVRSVLAESLLLAAVAGAAAAWIASAGGELLRKLLVQEDWAAPLFGIRVFGFVALTALIVGTLTGLVPAFLGGRPDVLASLRAGVRLSGWRRSRVRGLLMVGQVALTMVLLAGLGLFGRSLERATRVSFGVDAGHLLVASTASTDSKAPSLDLDALLARVRSLPGVRAASIEHSALPMFGYGVAYLRAEGVASLPNSTSEGGPFYSQIGQGYLDAAGLPLLRGRTFAAAEYVAPATVALVSQEMARRLWPVGNALGKCLYIQTTQDKPPCSSIVGIVGNVRQFVSEPFLMQYYVPLGSDPRFSGPDVMVRSVGDPGGLIAPLTAVLKTAVPGLPDGAVHTVPSLLDDQYRAWRLGTALFAMFGGLALLVAMVGLYSVIAFDGAQRTHEFGIRVALGARGWDLARLLLAQGLRYGATGLLLGLALVEATGRFLAPQLFHTSPHDPLALGAVGLLLLGGVVAACLAPAHSAVRVDPRRSLQAD